MTGFYGSPLYTPPNDDAIFRDICENALTDGHLWDGGEIEKATEALIEAALLGKDLESFGAKLRKVARPMIDELAKERAAA